MTGNFDLNSIEAFNEAFFSLVDKSEMEEDIKSDAKSHIRLSIVQNDENELSREIQKTKRVIEELNSEAIQLENNLDYFSNNSSDNPLFIDVTNKLERLKSKIEKYKEQMIDFRKVKRELEANNIVVDDVSIENDGDKEKNDS